uniref:Uncharacterized protein n=1 Tax=Knipowitschia caucasica TaxID=637954 RepID=A0AAV2L736_KNICA
MLCLQAAPHPPNPLPSVKKHVTSPPGCPSLNQLLRSPPPSNRKPVKARHVPVSPPFFGPGYHDDEHWSRQHLGVLRGREEGEVEKGRASGGGEDR